MLDNEPIGSTTEPDSTATPTDSASTPARPRRRRAATSPPGPPSDAAGPPQQDGASAATEAGVAGIDSPPAAASDAVADGSAAATEQVAAPPARRKRAPRKPAVPVGDPDAVPTARAAATSVLGAAMSDVDAVDVGGEPAAEPSETAARTPRPRTRRKASAPVAAPEPIADEIPSEAGALPAAPSTLPGAAQEPPPRPRRGRAKPGAPAVADPVTAAGAAIEPVGADSPASFRPNADEAVALAAASGGAAPSAAADEIATELEPTVEDNTAAAATPGGPDTATAGTAAAAEMAMSATPTAATPTVVPATFETATPEAEPPAEPPARIRTRRRSSSMAVTFQPPAEPELVVDQDEVEEPLRPARRGRRTAAQQRADEAALADDAALLAPISTAEPATAEPATAKPATAEPATAKPEILAEAGPSEVTADEDDAEDEEGRPSRRRRRGRRGRGRARGEGDLDEAETAGDTAPVSAAEEQPEAPAAAVEGDGGDTDGDEATSTTRRRRRRRRGTGTDPEAATAEDPPDTVVKVREPRQPRRRGGQTEADEDGVRGITGSTRMAAKRARRQEGRDTGRKRPPVISEAEFLARREAVERVMLVRQTGERTQVAVLEDNILVEHYVTKASASSYAGNIYLGRVQNVLPSMEAAFLDIGKGRNGVLYAGEVNYDSSQFAGRPRSIEAALKSGQQVLVQVTKDPIGSKGARLTSQISLPGRYVVYVPEGSMTGISRKLPETERKRLKDILRAVVPDDAGVIVRTAAEGASEDELIRDVERLQGQWRQIQAAADKAAKSSAPVLLHAEPDLVVRVVRDVFNEDFTRLVVQGDSEWEVIESYVDSVAPDLSVRLSQHTGELDLFATHRVDEQLAKALDRKVWLPSGGSLVIDRTEAMVVVDVNTGRFVGKGGNLEETVTRNNLEAAEEVVRQLRLRDLGGIIVVDFIDMVLESNRDLVLRRLTECLGRDRTKHQVAEVTSLGLVQMTRKRVGQGLLEAFSETCQTCGGRGVLVHSEPVDAPEPLEQASSGAGGNARAGSVDQGDEGTGAGRRGRRRAGSGSTITPLPVEDVRSPDGGAALAAVALAAARARRGSAQDPAGPEELASEDLPTIAVGGAEAPVVSDVEEAALPAAAVQPAPALDSTLVGLPAPTPDDTLAAPAPSGPERTPEPQTGGRRRRRGSAVRPAGPPVPVS